MANHKSAKKRCKQALKRNEVNRSLLSKIKNNMIFGNKKIFVATKEFYGLKLRTVLCSCSVVRSSI